MGWTKSLAASANGWRKNPLKEQTHALEIDRLAAKAEMPNGMRDTYAADWVNNAPDVKSALLPSLNDRFMTTVSSTPDGFSPPTKMSRSKSDGTMSMTMSETVVGGASRHRHGASKSLFGNSVFNINPNLMRSDLPLPNAVPHAAQVDAANRRLAKMFRLDEDRAALRSRQWFERPWTSTAPDVNDMQHTLSVSTAKLPWMEKALKVKSHSELEMVIRAIVEGVEDQMRSRPDHGFKAPFNPHRAAEEGHQRLLAKRDPKTEKIRQRVLMALYRYPLADVGELVGCNLQKWQSISQFLGGVSHGVVVQKAMMLSSVDMKHVERARFHAAGSVNCQRASDRGRVCAFCA